MYNEKILFLGIGGVSTSLLALYAKRCGATVIGYDAKESDTTRMLEKEGIKIYYKPRPCFTDYDYAVYSSAIKDDNPEIIKTKSLGKPCIERRDFLGFVASLHRRVVAVSGAHGKTTTTALISHIL
ncbi:MAG: Mur ligase domain-containing protein, partial [Christensenellales bacterium]